MIGALFFSKTFWRWLITALVSIGGFDFSDPSTYNATTSTIVDSARNIQGKLVEVVVR